MEKAENITEIHIVIAPDVGSLAKECQLFLKRGWELSGEMQLACNSYGDIQSIAQRLVFRKQQNER